MSQAIDLRALDRALFKSAKEYWAGAVAAKLMIFGLGLWSVFTSGWWYTPQAMLVVAVLSECLQLRSDVQKSRAESLLRTLDLCRSFARAISPADKRDIVLAAPRAQRRLIDESDLIDSYIDSTELPGPRRAVENLLESAWYTKNQASLMAWAYGGLVAVLLLSAVLAFVVTAREVTDVELRERIMKSVTSWLTLLVSLSMFKSVWAYFRLAARATKTEAACNHLLTGQVSETDAVKQWYEYQLTRASAPLIPDRLWRVMKPRLDEAWQSRAV